MASGVGFPTAAIAVSFGGQGKGHVGPLVPVSCVALQALGNYGSTAKSSIRTGLWDRLYTSMQSVHKLARENEFINLLIEGKMRCSTEYVVYLCNLFWLHRALEKAQERILEKYEDCPFIFPVLYRSERLLRDIRLWSFANQTAEKFADRDVHEEEFLAAVEHFVQPCVCAFALIAYEEPLVAVGSMFALYGTIMSGGQMVKEGVKLAFLERAREMKLLPPEKDDKDHSLLLQQIMSQEDKWDVYAEESVSFFSFPEGFNILDFKKEWHEALNKIPGLLPPSEQAAFQTKLQEECTKTVHIVLEAIKSLGEQLNKGMI